MKKIKIKKRFTWARTTQVKGTASGKLREEEGWNAETRAKRPECL